VREFRAIKRIQIEEQETIKRNGKFPELEGDINGGVGWFLLVDDDVLQSKNEYTRSFQQFVFFMFKKYFKKKLNFFIFFILN
jgi:hypothetical protein